jgi:hypothetical protein
VRYQQGGSSERNAFYESVGLTVLEDRMMITVHIFYNDESVYSLNTRRGRGRLRSSTARLGGGGCPKVVGIAQ